MWFTASINSLFLSAKKGSKSPLEGPLRFEMLFDEGKLKDFSSSGFLMMRTHNKQPEARVEPERYIVKVDKIAQNQKKIKDFLH